MIIERQRGGERNDFDIPPMKNGAVVDITDIVTTAFENAILQNLGNSVKVTFSKSVPNDSQFYPLDRNVPQYLYPHLSEFVRTGTASTELRNFIAQVITVQANNVIQRVQASGHSCLEFHPADMIMYANTQARSVYAFLRRHNDRFSIETETSFRVFTPEPEVAESIPEAAAE